MAFRPLHDRVLVRRLEAEEKTAGGIIIPDSAKEKPSEGEIVSVGEGTRDDSGNRVTLDVKAGDRVLFGKWSGTEVKIDGEDLIIMKESDIMGVLG
ncbi:co-chaperone GroES [Aurantiacibacter rhizosphaerae]|uniref:Co-chaperonin GroES n=1 Tax=Aurantiacibacter rhizosphaerae TaxID=2691582 RepID=A0A844XGY8_9SPHN|nr:co-chaperone GroES [Aurantiacibacter rhizosphaerae]MWV28834.1 co-chaperone GroES [Aurantiacibacter rhizosphaerae]